MQTAVVQVEKMSQENTFPPRELDRIMAELASVHQKCANLRESYIFHQFVNARAKEFATHGFARRLDTLVRCIDRVFEILPVGSSEIPSKEARHDATINIQASLFNVFGSIDNLAWIWVSEKQLTNQDGTQIKDQWVGLRSVNIVVRSSFSREFQEYLVSLDKWFSHLENFRHALAHRIPLYIPPYVVPERNETEYYALEGRMSVASANHNYQEFELLKAQQLALCVFRPWMTHSFKESARHVVFHAQLLADFNTVEEIGRKMLRELQIEPEYAKKYAPPHPH